MKIGDLKKVETLALRRAECANNLAAVRGREPLRFSAGTHSRSDGVRTVIPNFRCNRPDEHPALRAYFEAMILDELASLDRQLAELGVEVEP